MKSFKTYITITTLLFSVAANADRSRDGARGVHDSSSKQRSGQVAKQKPSYLQKRIARNNQRNNHAKHGGYLEKQIAKQRRNHDIRGAHDSRREVRNNKHGYAHHNNGSRNNHYGHNQHGFNGDYRNNRHFDNRNYRHNDNRRYGYNNHNRRYISQNYYRPYKHYKKWKKSLKKHRKWLRKHYRHLYNYNYYVDDYYRYRPLRGLGHYFDRPGYGYGHWHEGHWCRDHHDEHFYRNYYTYYPYQDGWRHGDGDFGIWFSFNF